MPLSASPNVGKLKEAHDVPGLIDALNYHADWDVVRAAADALGEIGGAEAVDPLVESIKVAYLKEDQTLDQAYSRQPADYSLVDDAKRMSLARAAVQQAHNSPGRLRHSAVALPNKSFYV